MHEIMKSPDKRADQIIAAQQDELVHTTKSMMADLRAAVSSPATLSVPIGKLAALGGGVASLIPAFRTVTQTTSFNVENLYRLTNASPGDVLKNASDGGFWGALKKGGGGSKMAKFESVDSIGGTSTAVMPINPAILMIAVALYSIEKQLGDISALGEEILSFLDKDKESEIEADVATLCSMMEKYKYNLDNERFLSSNHKQALDIQRTARKNMTFYQKELADALQAEDGSVSKKKVSVEIKSLEKKFEYYRLSLYVFSLASLLEIILIGNFDESYVSGIRDEIENLSMQYRELYAQCSVFVENKEQHTLEANVLKGAGAASNAVGKIIGNIPLIKEGQADEFLQGSGKRLKEKAYDLQQEAVGDFARLSDPGTHIFMEKMSDLIRIYNHTETICFDKDNIYLLAG